MPGIGIVGTAARRFVHQLQSATDTSQELGGLRVVALKSKRQTPPPEPSDWRAQSVCVAIPTGDTRLVALAHGVCRRQPRNRPQRTLRQSQVVGGRWLGWYRPWGRRAHLPKRTGHARQGDAAAASAGSGTEERGTHQPA